MSTRRDNPNGKLWRLAAEGFNHLLVQTITRSNTNESQERKPKTHRQRLWKEVADVYDTFLVGSCGRAIASETLSAETLTADESLENTILNTLGDKILKATLDAPHDVIFIFKFCIFLHDILLMVVEYCGFFRVWSG